MSFHQLPALAQNRLNRILAGPDADNLHQTARRLYDHYLQTYPSNNEGCVYAHAALCFLSESQFTAAAQTISRERGKITVLSAEGVLRQALEAGPADWKDDRDYFYTKGMMSINGRLAQVRKSLEKGSEFDTARQHVEPQYRPIIERGLEIVYGRKDDVPDALMNSRVLRYVAMQLMPPGQEKDFRMHALRLAVRLNVYMEHLRLSRLAIQSLGETLNIKVPQEFLVAESREASQPATPKPIAPAAIVEEDNPANLMAALKTLVARQNVNQILARAYLWRRSGDEPRTVADAARQFNVSTRQIEAGEEQIHRLLHPENAPGVSNGDLHQPRPVRP